MAGAALAADRDISPHLTDITFTITTVADLDEGESWSTDTTFHLRDAVTEEAATGDINATGTLTMSGDFVAAGECTDEACPGTTNGWGEFKFVDENGSWDGNFGFQLDDVEGTEVGKIMLIGRGGNAGKAIFGDTAFVDGEPAVEVTGQMVTLAKPSKGVKFFYDGCFVEPAGTTGAVLVTAGGVNDSGRWDAEYTLLIPGAMTFGESTVTTANGTIDSVLMLKSVGTNRIGHFMLLGGTGDYENLVGFGIVRTSAYTSAHCPNEAGAGGYWLGSAYAN